jgi:hypothetical protein
MEFFRPSSVDGPWSLPRHEQSTSREDGLRYGGPRLCGYKADCGRKIAIPTLLQQGPACKPPRVAVKDCPADDHEGMFRRQKSRQRLPSGCKLIPLLRPSVCPTGRLWDRDRDIHVHQRIRNTHAKRNRQRDRQGGRTTQRRAVYLTFVDG